MKAIPITLMSLSCVCFAVAVWMPKRRELLIAVGLMFWTLTIIAGYAGMVGRD